MAHVMQIQLAAQIDMSGTPWGLKAAADEAKKVLDTMPNFPFLIDVHMPEGPISKLIRASQSTA
eukprot:9120809-Karenia_brevis.AAC.1